MKLKSLLMGIVLLASVGSVSAQQLLCPGTGIPMSQDPGCMTQNMNATPAQQLPPQPPRPTGYWEKTWGAIAGNSEINVLGAALGASSRDEAVSQAISLCQSKGGGAGCKLEIAYYNQCVVHAVGARGSAFAHAGSVEKASRIGVKACSKKTGDSDCRVYYSACTEPIFHKY